jgi:hypothetical protein
MWLKRRGLHRATLRRYGSYLATPTTDGLMSAADKAAFNNNVAGWSLSTTRHYMLSKSGSDSNDGYSDSGSPDSSKAVLTWSKLLSIIPRNGNARKAVVHVEVGDYSAESVRLEGFVGYDRLIFKVTGTVATAGATAFAYDDADKFACGGAISSGTKTTGYNIAYSTKTITGCTFAGGSFTVTAVGHGFAVGDKILIEGVVGINVNGVAVVATTPTADTFTIANCNGFGTYVSGGAARRWKLTAVDATAVSFTDDDSARSTLTGVRVRFDSATTTSSLRNASTNCYANGVDTIIPGSNWQTGGSGGSEAPAAGDVCYFEEPAALVGAVTVNSCWNNSFFFVGFDCASISLTGTRPPTFVFTKIRTTGTFFSASNTPGVTVQSTWTDDGGTTKQVGSGLMHFGTSTVSIGAGSSLSGFTKSVVNPISGNGRMTINGNSTYSVGGATVCVWGIDVLGSGLTGANHSGTVTVTTIGNSSLADVAGAAFRMTRINRSSSFAGGGIQIQGGNCLVHGVDISGQDDEGNCIDVSGTATKVQIRSVTGSRGNSNYGLGIGKYYDSNLYGAIGALVGITQGNSAALIGQEAGYIGVAGAKGHIRMSGDFNVENPFTNECEFEWTFFQFYAGITDKWNNTIKYFSAQTATQKCGHVFNPHAWQSDESSAAKFLIWRTDSTANKACLAQADSAANATNVLGVSLNMIDALNKFVLLKDSDKIWVQFDAASTPAINDDAWLSTSEAGKAQDFLPVDSGTRPTQRSPS